MSVCVNVCECVCMCMHMCVSACGSVWGVSVDTIREVSTLGEEFSPMAALGVLGP